MIQTARAVVEEHRALQVEQAIWLAHFWTTRHRFQRPDGRTRPGGG